MSGTVLLVSMIPVVLIVAWNAIQGFERLHFRPESLPETLGRFAPTEPVVWLRHDPRTLTREQLLAEARIRGFEEHDCCAPDADGSQLLVFRRA